MCRLLILIQTTGLIIMDRRGITGLESGSNSARDLGHVTIDTGDKRRLLLRSTVTAMTPWLVGGQWQRLWARRMIMKFIIGLIAGLLLLGTVGCEEEHEHHHGGYYGGDYPHAYYGHGEWHHEHDRD